MATNGSELFRTGDLDGAIRAQLDYVKNNPADVNARLFLFELSLFAGDLERSRRQIGAVKYSDMELDHAVAVYTKLISAEESRRRTYKDAVAPKFFGPPNEDMRLRLEVLDKLRAGNHQEANKLLGEINHALPIRSGTANGEAFEGFRDSDDLLAGVIEIYLTGEYYWMPINSVTKMTISAPKFPRDLYWLPITLEDNTGSQGQVFMPTLYFGSHESADVRVKLGRYTDWQEETGGIIRGKGQREFLAGESLLGILEVREIVFS